MDNDPGSCIYKFEQSSHLELTFGIEICLSPNLNMISEPSSDLDLDSSLCVELSYGPPDNFISCQMDIVPEICIYRLEQSSSLILAFVIELVLSQILPSTTIKSLEHKAFLPHAGLEKSCKYISKYLQPKNHSMHQDLTPTLLYEFVLQHIEC